MMTSGGDHRVTGEIGQGVWWAGIAMMTIGWGDLVPQSLSGWLLAMVWMLTSMMLTGAVTAYVVDACSNAGTTSSLTRLVQGRRVAVVRESAAGWAVTMAGGPAVLFDTVEGALETERVDGAVAGRDDLRAHGRCSAPSTTAQPPLSVAMGTGAEDFVWAINRRDAAPSRGEQRPDKTN